MGYHGFKPTLTIRMGWTLVEEGNVFKLLGTTFGLLIKTNDVDELLFEKFRKYFYC